MTGAHKIQILNSHFDSGPTESSEDLNGCQKDDKGDEVWDRHV